MYARNLLTRVRSYTGGGKAGPTPGSQDPSMTPLGINGKPLESWQKVHDQFKTRLPRPHIDTDDRDIGAYPRVPADESYHDREYRVNWDDKANRRMFGEPLPEQFDVQAASMLERGKFRMWYMLTSVGCFLGSFVVWWYVVQWWERKWGVPRKPHPFGSDPRYTIKSA